MDKKELQVMASLARQLVRNLFEHDDKWFASDDYKNNIVSITRPYLFACHQCMKYFYILETEQGRM